MSLTALFSDIFARQDNWLARLDPRMKLGAAAAGLAGVLLSGHAAFPIGVSLLCLTATVAVGVPTRQVALRLAGPMTMVGTAVTLRWWLDAGSLQSGAALISRVLGGVSIVLLLTAVTPAHRIFHALRALGMPRGWVEMALLMYRYTFTLLDMVADLTAAQKVRLGYADIRRGWTSAGMVAGTVVLRSVDQAVRAHEAMQVRGYRGEMPFGPMPTPGWRDWLALAGALVLLLGLYCVLEWRLA